MKVEFIKEKLTFSGDDSAMSMLLPSMLGAVAGFERSLIRERQREGIALLRNLLPLVLLRFSANPFMLNRRQCGRDHAC